MVNELRIGTRRTGDFYDSNAETPEVKVTLERSESGIGTTIAWSNSEVPYAAWFVPDRSIQSFLTDGQKPPATYAPKRVLFHDSHGAVLLIGCRPKGFHSSFSGPGSGTLWAKAAILGVPENREFDSPHGLQTEISGLREWLGVTSWEEQFEVDDPEHRVTIKSLPTTKLLVGEHKGLTLDFRSGWGLSSDSERDGRVLLDLLRCTTRSVDPIDWDMHMQVHRAIRDLLTISRWRNESCVPVRTLREDDPLTTMDGKEHGDQWREVVVPNDERTPKPKGYHPHLLEFADLGTAGIARWLSLRDDFSRALDPVLTSISLRNTTPNTRLAHTGPGLEALGYLLMLRDGMDSKKADRATLQSRFERILLDLGNCLPFDGPTWVKQTVKAYNGLKHANRTMPDEADVMNAWADSVMVVRAWVAVKLGITEATLTSRLSSDRQPREFTKTV